jgi:hypothetical protein
MKGSKVKICRFEFLQELQDTATIVKDPKRSYLSPNPQRDDAPRNQYSTELTPGWLANLM